MKRLPNWIPAAAALLLSAALSPRAEACAACFSRSESPLAYGMNAGILSLLGVVATVLGLIASFFVFVSRRASRLQDAEAQDPSV